ncbi:MAG: aromatic aminobenezylarsenical efflux permease ArsG family transporter [Acidobacteriota bacterium]|jgi:cytochrome c biogenesis protein CcdA|nr:aromatic aminobenezylarsenical efflux permease ArsG family transporter [Acidobacteriota bacterium]
MGSFWMAVGTALWLGILTSISPCPLSTNIAAVSYVGRRVGSGRAVLLSGVLYTSGRSLAYLVLGAASVWSLMSMVSVSTFLQGTFSRLLGPILIVLGLVLLGIFEFRVPSVGVSDGLQARVDRAGVWGAGILGLVFALAFCPVSAGLFFGGLVPLAVERSSPLLLPVVYGIGTALPVIIFAALLAAGARRLGAALDRVQVFERWARRVTALVFIGVGVYETLRSTLFLI